MALNWKKAQENEKKFWESIYLKKSENLYSEINDDDSISFCKEILYRHNLEPTLFDGKIIMDLGCGPYGLIKGMLNLHNIKKLNFEKIFGVDPLMDYYKEKIGILSDSSIVKLYSNQGENLPFENNSIDVIFSTNVLDHCQDPSKVVNEVKRVLKSNGHFYCSLHVVYPIWSFLTPFLKYIDKNHPHHFTKNKILKVINKNFKNLKVSYQATIYEDHPKFKKLSFSSNFFKSFKRFISNYVLYTVYINCSN